MKNLVKLIILLTLLISTGCTYKPILAPNAKYNEAGKEVADADIDSCMTEADVYLEQYKADKIKKTAARNAAVGTAIGGITGAIFGKHSLKGAGVGALIGAGAGAVLGAADAATQGKINPDVMKERYVNSCLSQKGYSVLGWQ